MASYFVIVDTETGRSEAVPNPGASAQRGAGMQAIVLMVSTDARVVLTGSCSPAIERQLRDSGIQVIAGLSGTVGELIDAYRSGQLAPAPPGGPGPTAAPRRIDSKALVDAARTAVRQFATIMPILIGVVLLVGLFRAFMPERLLGALFTGNAVLDTLWGACFGSILAGNPVNSYIIGDALLEQGVSLFAVTAFIITWVGVGIVQLPAEAAALGWRFALTRNALSFVLALPVAMLTVLALNVIGS